MRHWKLRWTDELSGSHGNEYDVSRMFWNVVPCRLVKTDRHFRGYRPGGGSNHL